MPFQFLKSPLSYKRHTSAMVCRDQSFSKSDDTLIFTDVYEEDLFTKDPDCIRKITWTTTPKNDYTNAECRIWIGAQLRAHYIFLSRSSAISIASNFVGSGYTMYAMEKEDWVEMLGVHGYVIRFLIRRILWNKSTAMKAGFSAAAIFELRGEYKPEMASEEDLIWSGLYSIKGNSR
ncbi:hypothetical protein BCIN_11g05640 [Botrytis cinerea B05.10]|uniref:Uncharacterized protein n=1 Tax=Botryotinia fuckeliana (strain B05.10) TaxID=332648 RepID=A0A384JXF9_BOTFB|nr:hypothetical protein BCIN_11g05640 [Botrytis cinerea B05.10]ATZ55296.1 hypothetical protein BCIN_11g05640 [Botrytis cinerea B05.10]